ncbi:MAG TPA: glycosyltransferase [Thermoplasmata archaeon]|nr:glycosyltransferase [Thermoplasmata archaeon]
MGAITFAQPYPDPRSDKIARGLAARGISVRRFLIDFDAAWQTTFSPGAFEGVRHLPDLLRRHVYLAALSGLGRRALRRIVERLPGTVVRTSTPDLVGAAAVRTGKRIVAEVYDTWSLYDAAHEKGLEGRIRQRIMSRAERAVHEDADLVVYTTQAMLDYARTRYRMREAIVVPNAVLAADLPKAPLPKLSEDGRSHCVYVGLVQPWGLAGSRSLLPFFRELSKEHVVHVYGVTEKAKLAEVRRELEGVAVWHDPVPQERLLRELTQYDFGLNLLPRIDVARFETVIPNKMYEYLGAGIPVLVSPYRAMVEFVRKYECGTVYREGTPTGRVPLRPEFLLDTYLVKYADVIRRLGS